MDKFNPIKEASKLNVKQKAAVLALRDDGQFSGMAGCYSAATWRALEARDIAEVDCPSNPTSGNARLTEYGLRIRRVLA